MLIFALPLLCTPSAFQEALLDTPFVVRADQRADSALVLETSAAALEGLRAVHDEGLLLRLAGFPLPGGGDLVLRPVSALEPGALAQVVGADGRTSWVAPSVRCFAGHVEGGGAAFLAFSATQVQGYFSVGGENYFLSSGKGSGLEHVTLAPASLLDTTTRAEWCSVLGEERAPESGVQGLVASPTVLFADLFIECDEGYRALFGSDQECIDYAVLLTSAASEIYHRDLGVALRIPSGFIRVWNTPVPWGHGDVGAVQTWWNSNQNSMRGVQRAGVHVLSNPVFGGVAFLDVLCVRQNSYQLSSVDGAFPHPIEHTSWQNWDLLVFTHELGHSFGSPHTFDYRPPINDCTDGTGPDAGTIMGYCHLNSGGVANVGMRFHSRCQDHLLADIDFFGGCLEGRSIERGDYDWDDDRDQLDLAALDGVLTQGFRSASAELLFDFDEDGTLDAFDREVLQSIVRGDPPGAATERNGSGINEDCYSTFERPLIGRTWQASVFALGVGTPVLMILATDGIPGIQTRFGELLVALPALGGTIISSTTLFSEGIFAEQSIPIPADISLLGLDLTSQALVLRPNRQHFCNALDLHLGLY